jgi:phosphopantetheine adenylyltransferase
MNIIVVYPGRFHPFHRGHKASYDWLINKFGDGVYIATSNVQNPEDSPFGYDDKVKMMTKLGVPSGHIVQTKNPYQAKEIVGALSDEGINIQMISTSEIKTSVVIDEKYLELAVRALHKAFELEQNQA